MSETDTERLIDEKLKKLAERPANEIWAANAAICARLFVLAAPGWQRWPEVKAKALEGFHAMLLRSVEADPAPASDVLIAGLESFDVEDDGSQEWQDVVDSLSMIINVLNGDSPEACLREAMTMYLDGRFHAISIAEAKSLGRPISHPDAVRVVEADPAWRAAIDFVMAL